MENKDMYTLKEIIFELYKEKGLDFELNNSLNDTEKYPQEFDAFHSQKNKEFNDIIKTVDLEDEFKLLKKSKGFHFTNSDKIFIKDILNEYTQKLEPLRRADYFRADSSFVCKLHDGFIDIFRNANLPDKILLAVDKKINNRIKYPVKKLEFHINRMADNINDLISKAFFEYTPGIPNLNKNDKYIWMSHMANDFELFYKKWDAILEYMSIQRTEEIEELIHKYSSSLNEEEINNFCKNRVIFEKSKEIIDQNNDYKEICNEINKLLKFQIISEDNTQNPVGSNDKGYLKSKDKQPFISKIEKQYYNRLNEKEEILNTIYNEVSNSLFNCDYKPNDFSTITLDGLIPSAEILEKAKKEYYCELNSNKLWDEAPDLSEETKKEIDKEYKEKFNR